ncbi:MAG: RNA polymerase sporulation sigma factor SigH [Firmicutes bacterium]|nr:RNA polymerase sporulation sigma factor SigH [Bacillota bacterium]
MLSADQAYAQQTDEALVAAAQNGDIGASEFLLKKYRPMIMGKARTYFIAGADRDDILQEGMIGLHKAVRDFCPSRGASFRPFAEMCITRQVITAVKAASRQKHAPLNYYLSLDKPIYSDGTDRHLLDVLPDHRVCDPEEMFLVREELADVWGSLRHLLSDFEYQVFMLYLGEQSYREIASALETTPKAVDNALCRAKRKIEERIKVSASA